MEAKNGIIDLLSKVDIFKGVPYSVLPVFADRFRPVNFKAQEIVIGQGERVQNFYIVAKGRFEAYIKDQTGMQAHISYLLSRDYFGDFYLLNDQPSSTEIMAIEESECVCLSRDDFFGILEIDPEISQHILRSMLKQLHKTNVVEEAARYKEKALLFLQQNKRIGQYTNIIGKTKIIQDVNEAIESMAGNDAPLLIEGEYGTGKELVARIIHSKGSRAVKPFISADCEKLATETMHTQLFGDYSFYAAGQKGYGMGFSYMELAEGGSLLLKNIEVLPLEIQLRLRELILSQGKQGSPKLNLYIPDVRIIATSREDLITKLKKRQFDQMLFDILSKNRIYLPPLRERKRDIPELVDHFIKKYAQYYNKNVDKVSPKAMEALLGYDYKLSNAQELEEVIQRAISLTRSDSVRSEHLFLGQPAAKPLVLFNLLSLKFFTSWVSRRIFPEKIREIVAILFLVIIGISLFSHQISYPWNNIGKILTWSIWWPAMFLSFFFIGRFWCSICPYATYSHLGKMVIKREQNFPLKKYDYLFMTIGFLFVIWVEEVSGMRNSSFKVGVLQLTIVSLAIIMGMVYKRDTWCRFICPLGALISTCSMTSIIEVRSNPDVCLNHCTTHDCYKGRDDIPGCPMFQHLMYVDNNQTCKICLNCVRSCTHENISLNVRPPATEIYNSNHLNKGLFLFVISLMGILIPILMMHKHIINHRVLPFTFVYLLTPAIILFVLWLVTKAGFKGKEQSYTEVLWRSTYAYIPLALTAYIAFQIQFLPIVNNFLFSLPLSPSISANIVVYSKTLFYFFQFVYLILEIIIYFKLIAYIIISFKVTDFKEDKKGILMPFLSSMLVGLSIYFLPKINSFVFSFFRPAAEATTIVYSIRLLHVFQVLLVFFGVLISLYCMLRIIKKFRESNRKSNRFLLMLHFLVMALYSIIVLFLLMI